MKDLIFHCLVNGFLPRLIMRFISIFLITLSLLTQTAVFGQKGKRQPTMKMNAATESKKLPEQQIQNLYAFSKLYGYVRYFHPSDEAARLNWGKFAIYGAQKVQKAQTPEELQQTLKKLFLPIAPTLQILRTGEKPLPIPKPNSLKGLKIVAWQHQGVGVGMYSFGDNTPYKSVRLNREEDASQGSEGGLRLGHIYREKEKLTVGSLGYTIGKIREAKVTSGSVQAFWGKELKFSIALRTELEDFTGYAQTFLRIDTTGGQQGFYGNNYNRPITSSAWAEYNVTTEVPKSAEGISFGCTLYGKGTLWADDIRLYVRNNSKQEWKLFPLKNGNFEEVHPYFTEKNNGTCVFPNWEVMFAGYRIGADVEKPFQGKYAARIEYMNESSENKLFAEKPKVDELLIKELGGGLQCAFPVALYSDSVSTLGSTPESRAAFEQLLYKFVNPIELDRDALEQESVRLAESIMAWNALKHFYPYFDVVGVNWDSVLTATLQATLRSSSAKEFFPVMRRMLEPLQDGHATYVPNYRYQMIPCVVANIEGKSVVLASQDSVLQRGDILLSIDSVDVGQRMQEEIGLVSGTSEWKRHKAAENLLLFKNTEAVITVERNGKVLSNVVKCGRVRSFPFEHPKMQQISASSGADAVWYVDMAQVSVADIDAKITDLSLAKGVIFDLRGYPNDNGKTLEYLTDSPLQSMRWNIPQIIYPDQERVQGYDTNGRWQLVPKKPRINGKVVFLAGNGTYSQGESILNIVEQYHLGEIVGAESAGANGNVIMFPLIGSGVITWTGMKILKHDGSQHHTIGIQPTIRVERTVKGLREGRDEVVDAALLHITKF